MTNLKKIILTSVLNQVKSGELTVEAAKEILEIAGVVEMRKIYKKSVVSKELMDKCSDKTVFILTGSK